LLGNQFFQRHLPHKNKLTNICDKLGEERGREWRMEEMEVRKE